MGQIRDKRRFSDPEKSQTLDTQGFAVGGEGGTRIKPKVCYRALSGRLLSCQSLVYSHLCHFSRYLVLPFASAFVVSIVVKIVVRFSGCSGMAASGIPTTYTISSTSPGALYKLQQPHQSTPYRATTPYTEKAGSPMPPRSCMYCPTDCANTMHIRRLCAPALRSGVTSRVPNAL